MKIYQTRDKVRVVIARTAMPAQTQYHQVAWWAATLGRNPDIEIAGPCATKAELLTIMRAYKTEERY